MTEAGTGPRSGGSTVGRLLVALGAIAVLVGVLVLQSSAARQSSFGWFAYSPPAPELLDSLVVFSPARLAGAGLTVVGLIVLALGAGHELGRAGRFGGLVSMVAGVVGGLLVVGGVMAFALVPRRTDIEYGGTYRLLESPPPAVEVVARTVVWLPYQAWAVGVVGLGLIVLALAAGLRYGRR